MRPSIGQIIESVTHVCGVHVNQINGPCRHPDVVQAREIIIHLARNLTTMSFPEIGAAMGGRNHSTIITAYWRRVRRPKDVVWMSRYATARSRFNRRMTAEEAMQPRVSVAKVIDSSGVRQEELAWCTEFIGQWSIEEVARDCALTWYRETDQCSVAKVTLRIERCDGKTWLVVCCLAPTIACKIKGETVVEREAVGA